MTELLSATMMLIVARARGYSSARQVWGARRRMTPALEVSPPTLSVAGAALGAGKRALPITAPAAHWQGGRKREKDGDEGSLP